MKVWVLTAALVVVIGLTTFLGSRLVDDIDKNKADIETITKSVTELSIKNAYLEKETQRLRTEKQQLHDDIEDLKRNQEIKDAVNTALEKKEVN